MAIIERTNNLNLTQFKGGSIKPAILDYYTSDMLKIDNAFGTMETDIDEFEADVTASVTALETLVNSFDTRVSTLEDCCSDVNTTLLNYGSRLVEIERVIDTVSTANIDDIIERVNALENKVNTNITNINILRNDIHELDERMGVAESTLVQHATDITNQGNRIATLEDCCGTVNSELVRIEGKVDSNKGEIDGIKERLDRDEVNIAGNANDITILSQQVDINTADIEDLKQGLAELDPTSQLEVVRQVAINTENISNLQTSVTAQASNLSALTTRVASVEGDIVDLKADNVSLHNEIASVQGWESRISGAEATAQQASADATQALTDVASVASDVTALDTRLTTDEGTISSQGTRITTLESKVATDESAFTALETRVSANEADLTNIHATITADESGLASVGNRVTALETQNGNTPLNTTAQTLSGGVNEVNTLVVNADSKAAQALSTANSASATATQASADATQASTDAAQAIATAQQASSDASDVASDVGDLSQLTTTDKSSVVDAINEVNAKNPLAWTLLGTANGTNSVNFGKSLSEFNDISFVIHNNTSSGGNDLYTITVPCMSLSANKIVYGSGGATCSNGIRANVQISSDAKSAHISTVWHQGSQIQSSSSLYVYGR